MTKEETENAIKVMQAYVDGKQIEFCTKRDKKWELCDNPLFDWNAFDYRVAEIPQYRPFNNPIECLKEIQNHCPVGWVWYAGNYYNIININYGSISLLDSILTFKQACKECTFPDTGEPFGIKI